MDTIRITSGKYRGRAIRSPRSNLTHPMGAREKLALSNMVRGVLLGAKVLDAFAGSGALGIEALSNGAESVVFVEKAPAVAKVIRENLDSLGLTANARVLVGDAEKIESDEKFNLIIADPPYDNFKLSAIEHLVSFLADGGTLVLSHPGEAPELPGLGLLKSNHYAGACLSVYHK